MVIQYDPNDLVLEEDDEEFKGTGMDLRAYDYYPVLGRKEVWIKVYDEVCLKEDTEAECLTKKQKIWDENKGIKIEIEGYEDRSDASCVVEGTDDARTSTTIDKARAKFTVYCPPSVKEGEMIIRVKSERGGKQLKGKIGFYIKSNKNVKFDEIIAGREVYTQDADIESQSTSTYIGFNYIQELFNQVTPRKRTVTGYVMIDEDGKYNETSKNGLRAFKDNFSFGVNNVVDYALDTTTNIADYHTWDDTSATFRKLIKDYGKRTTNTNDSKAYIDKIIDKETLIGTNNQTTDTQVTTGDIVTSTGLYELYANVVRPFVGKMIEEGDNYRNTTGYQNTDGNWKPRTYSADPAQTQSVSYCFGCKQTRQEFIDTVSRWDAPPNNVYQDIITVVGYESDDIQGNEYRGNIYDNSGYIAAGGTKKWPGLISGEWYIWYYNPLTDTFNPRHWAGIDCSGFVQRTVEPAKRLNTIGSIKVTIPSQPENINSQQLFERTGLLYNFDKKLENKLRKGDLVQYDGHVSTVYSDSPSCVTMRDSSGNSTTTCTYEIIHAYGWDTYAKKNPATGRRGKPEFSRKVLVTGEDIVAAPTGFGRIKLWD